MFSRPRLRTSLASLGIGAHPTPCDAGGRGPSHDGGTRALCTTKSSLRRVSGSVAIVFLCMGGLCDFPASAHQSPTLCVGNTVTLSVTSSVSVVLLGGLVQYDVGMSNLPRVLTPNPCDATGIEVAFYCPGADGLPDFTMPHVFTA